MKSLIVTLLALSSFNSMADAHEKRSVGEYDFVVGFINEPAYSMQFNAVDLKISKKGVPVENLEDKLSATLTHADSSKSLPLKPRYGRPGEYAAYFIPTASGHYSFRFEGTLNDATIDETFSSENGKFSSVGDSTDIMFPMVKG